ncbi:MAG: NAD(P)H-binding protein, partial [Syntrophobacteraceae bacterium]|nr:NAD(P)H-binding protein [Syntrophobacteraceae bacterium]
MERSGIGNMGPVAVLGATGYVGGRLVPELLRRGYRVRALVRSPEKLRCRPFSHVDHLEITRANALDEKDLRRALQGCSTAFYLVRSTTLGGGTESKREDLQAARNMVHAAHNAGLSRIICLGPQPTPDDCKDIPGRDLPVDPGEILKSGPVPVTWLRTSMILGSGSASFEIIRHLAERMPVMLAPRWLRSKTRPVAIRDVLHCLAACLESLDTAGIT